MVRVKLGTPDANWTTFIGASPIHVLVVDDVEANVRLFRRVLPHPEFALESAVTAADGWSMIERRQPDVVLLDVRMPVRDGFNLCRQMKAQPSTCLVPVILVTAASESADRLRAIEAGADDFVAKPVNPSELRARVRALARMKRYTDDLESAEQVILSLALTIEARDAYTDGHCQRLAHYAVAMGKALRLDAEQLRALQWGGFLHDLGKIAIPDAVLLKPAALSPEEFDTMKTHPVVGERLCGQLRSLATVRPIVRSHHERLDGSGYPDALAGDDIPLLAQIMGVVDVYDALTTRRPHRAAFDAATAAAFLREEVARGWRRHDHVALLLQLVARGLRPGGAEPGSYRRLQ